jgi:O-antigen ligase
MNATLGSMMSASGAALAALFIGPFLSGAVSSQAWVPMAWLWLGLGLWAAFSRRGQGTAGGPRTPSINGLFGPVHLLIALQLIPLPPALLRLLSPGSYAARFIPPPAVETWAPLSVSLNGTLQAWLFVAGVHGLVLTLFHDSAEVCARRRRLLLVGMAWVGGLLALEGLVQAASPHPFRLYGIFAVPGIGSHEAGVFGPYYNRDHFSNLIAMAASVTAGLLARRITAKGSRSWASFASTSDFMPALALSGALVVMFAASAASGSRGGLAGIAGGVGVGLATPFLARPRQALFALLVLALVLFGTGVPAAIERFADVDFETSRLMVWRDTLRLLEFFPFLGCGVGAFAPAYWPYQRVVRFEYWPHAHNEYLQWILEGGLAAFLLALFWLRTAWRLLPSLVRNQEIRPALAGLVAALIHAVVECSLRIPANAAWAAALLGCVLAGVASKESAREAA